MFDPRDPEAMAGYIFLKGEVEAITEKVFALEQEIIKLRTKEVKRKSQLDRIEGRLDGIAEGIRTIACVRATPCKKYKPVK